MVDSELILLELFIFSSISDSIEIKYSILNNFFAVKPSRIQFLKDFLLILAFKRISGIVFFFILVSMLGQISESIKIAIDGDQCFKNLFTINV